MEVLTRKESDGEIMETLCRLCGTNDCGRMLHLGDTYSMVGASDIIFNLLDSISVILKLQVCGAFILWMCAIEHIC